MSDIHYVTGDATYPRGSGPRIIAHNCNDAGRWGAGFVEAVSERFPSVETAYREWAESSTYGTLPLGEVQFVQVGDSLWIANMIGQVGRRTLNVPPIRYYALKEALERVGEHALDVEASVHMPRIGTGLAGGSWARIEHLIRETLLRKCITTYIYDLPGGASQ